MLITQAPAPEYQELRPLKSVKTNTFPVYHDLVERLLAGSKHPDDIVAHVLATCAGYAYSDAQTVAMIMARMGLENNRCLSVAQSVDAMFICSTAFLVQSECGRVAILCYRGTEPSNFISWLTDADVNPEKVPFSFPGRSQSFDVHAGFYRNVRATRYQLIAALQRALDGQSVLPDGKGLPNRLEALYVTGHSLGAAMAALLAVMLVTETAYAQIAARLKATYTYGQPMIGSPKFAEASNGHAFLKANTIRYIYGHDVVSALPPTVSGEFAHFGTERRLSLGRHGEKDWVEAVEPTRQVSHLTELLLAAIAFPAKQLRWSRNLMFRYSLNDHGPQHYIAALTPPEISSEFGI
jgi:hypothetical protein